MAPKFVSKVYFFSYEELGWNRLFQNLGRLFSKEGRSQEQILDAVQSVVKYFNEFTVGLTLGEEIRSEFMKQIITGLGNKRDVIDPQDPTFSTFHFVVFSPKIFLTC